MPTEKQQPFDAPATPEEVAAMRLRLLDLEQALRDADFKFTVLQKQMGLDVTRRPGLGVVHRAPPWDRVNLSCGQLAILLKQRVHHMEAVMAGHQPVSQAIARAVNELMAEEIFTPEMVTKKANKKAVIWID